MPARRLLSGLLITALAASALSACGAPSATTGVMKAGPAKGGLFGLSTAEDIKATTPAAFKGATNVVVGGFTIGFTTLKTDSRKAGGGLMGNGFGGKSSAKSELQGIDKSTMQAITDKAYADFTSRLKSAGYNVVNRDALTSNSSFAKVTSYQSGEESTSGFLSTTNKVTFMSPSSFGGKFYSFMDVPEHTGGFGWSNAATVAADITGKNEGAYKVVSAVYMVDFANSDGHGNAWTMSSSVSVGQGLTVLPDMSKLTIIGGQMGTFSSGIGNLALGQPVQSDKEFATPKELTTETGKAVEVAVNVIGTLGGIGSNMSRQFAFETTPAKYTAAAMDALTKANTALVGKAASLR